MCSSHRLLFCACKTAVSMGPRHDLSFCACTTAWLAPEILGSMGSSPHLWFCAFKTATLWPQLLVSMGPRPHLSFCACKTAFISIKTLITHLWFLLCKTVPGPLQSVVFACKTATFGPEWQDKSSMCPSKTAPLGLEFKSLCVKVLCFFCKYSDFMTDWQVCWGSSPHLWFCAPEL